MTEFRLTQISDTHLARRLPKLTANFDRIRPYIDTTRPDLVVNSGNLAFAAPAAPDDLAFAKSLHDALPLASGPVHQRRDFTFGHTRHVWAPSAGFIISDARQERIGAKEVGLVEYRFQTDSFEVRHVKAPGQIDVDLDELLGKAS